MLHSILFAALTLSASFVFAAKPSLDSKPCASFARGAAEATYLSENTGIQGHEWSSGVVQVTMKKNETTVMVEVDGANDESDTWTAKYEVIVNTTPEGYCSLAEVNEVK